MKRALLLLLALGCGSHPRVFDDVDSGAATSPPGSENDAAIAPGDGGAPQTTGTCDEAAKQKGYAGCDFVFGPPSLLGEATRPPCFAALIANNSSAPAKLKVSYDGQALDATTFGHVPTSNPDPTTWPTLPATGVPPKGVAILYLSHDPSSKHIVVGTSLACPGPTAVQEPQGAAVPWPHRGTTFRVEADHPITAYDVAPFGGAKSFFPSAELLLPTTAWGTSYVVATPPLAIPPSQGDQPSESEWVRVVAQSDNTQVTLLGSTNMEAPSLADAVQQGVPKTVTLKAGEYIQYHSWRLPSVSATLTGTVLTSNKPVAVFGGDLGVKVATQDSQKAAPIKGQDMTPRFCCLDSAHQQIQPVSALGFDYVGAPYTTRRADLQEESILYRVVGVVDGTSLTFDPPIAGAPAALGKGEVANFEAKGAVRVKSQDALHPFHFSRR